jgi:uncharacterized membrane protein
MGFVLWVCTDMHVFGIIVWLGGLMFQGAVITPIINIEGAETRTAFRKVSQRFVGFIWMSVWTVAVTGVLMMLLNSHYIFLSFRNTWSVLLGFKHLVFILMVIYSFAYARMLKYLSSPSSNGGYNSKADLYLQRVNQYRTINIFLGITAVLLSAGMAVAD